MSKEELDNILKDYHWMINSIAMMRRSLQEAGDNLTAQYGIEAAMPKERGTTGDPIYREVKRREKRWTLIDKYEERVQFLQSRMARITDEREAEVLHWLLEGRSYRWIGQHMKLSFSHIKRLRDSILNQMSETNGTNGTNDTKGTDGTDLKSRRNIV